MPNRSRCGAAAGWGLKTGFTRIWGARGGGGWVWVWVVKPGFELGLVEPGHREKESSDTA